MLAHVRIICVPFFPLLFLLHLFKRIKKSQIFIFVIFLFGIFVVVFFSMLRFFIFVSFPSIFVQFLCMFSLSSFIFYETKRRWRHLNFKRLTRKCAGNLRWFWFILRLFLLGEKNFKFQLQNEQESKTKRK